MHLEYVEKRYEGLRQAARHAAALIYRKQRHDAYMTGTPWDVSIPANKFILTGVDEQTRKALYKHKTEGDMRFDWEKLIEYFRTRPKRFEAAAWVEDDLLGVAFGLPSDGPDNVTLHYMERMPGMDEIKGHMGYMALDAMNNYAKMMGKSRLRVKRPRETDVSLFESLGFRHEETDTPTAYMEREVLL